MNERELKALSTDELKRLLAGTMELTARHLVHMAGIWRELEERGEDLSDLRHGIAVYLPMIAHGRVDAAIVIKYAGQKTLLAALSNLPITVQRRIAETGYVALVSTHEDSIETVEVPLSRLSAAAVHQVFSDDGVRSPEDQIRMLERRRVRPAKAPKAPRRARRVKIDRENHTLIVSNTAADIDRVVDQLSAYYGVDIRQMIEEKAADPSCRHGGDSGSGKGV
jgi:hypothetical protein